MPRGFHADDTQNKGGGRPRGVSRLTPREQRAIRLENTGPVERRAAVITGRAILAHMLGHMQR